MPFGVNAATGRPGPAPKAARDDDRVQARQRVNVEVRTGRRPHPNTLSCVDCGHVWAEGKRRHEYDHHLGYAAEHHLDVEPVCTRCHHARDDARLRITHCVHGHAYTPENTKQTNGTRECRTCRRDREKRTRTAEWWRTRKARRAAAPEAPETSAASNWADAAEEIDRQLAAVAR